LLEQRGERVEAPGRDGRLDDVLLRARRNGGAFGAGARGRRSDRGERDGRGRGEGRDGALGPHVLLSCLGWATARAVPAVNRISLCPVSVQVLSRRHRSVRSELLSRICLTVV